MPTILILMMFAYGSNGGNAFTSSEFSGRAECEAAATALKAEKYTGAQNSTRSLYYVCVRK